MKKLTSLIAAAVAAVTATLSLTSCGGGREKFDFSKVNTLTDLNGSVIAAQTGTFHLDALKGQTTGVEVKEYPDFTQLLVALNSGAIDGYVAEEPTAYSIIAQNEGLDYVHLKNNSTGFRATAADTGIAVAFKTGSKYVARVNAILSGVSEESRAKLMQQAVTMSIDTTKAINEQIELSDADYVEPSDAPVLKVAMECAYDPFNWTQITDVNGAVKISGSEQYANGYDVQMAKYIARSLGMRLEIYSAKWEALITGVQAGTFDAVIAGMSPTAEREEEVDFTDVYYNSNLVIIYKK